MNVYANEKNERERGKDDLQNPLSHLQWLPSRTPRIVGNKLRLDGCTLRVEMLNNIERVDIYNKQVGPSNINKQETISTTTFVLRTNRKILGN